MVSISQADITSIVGQGLYIVLIVSAPMLITALIVGFIVSIFQAATQINEQTLSFVPKVVGVFVSIIACGPWMLTKLMNYTQQLYNYIITVLNKFRKPCTGKRGYLMYSLTESSLIWAEHFILIALRIMAILQYPRYSAERICRAVQNRFQLFDGIYNQRCFAFR